MKLNFPQNVKKFGCELTTRNSPTAHCTYIINNGLLIDPCIPAWEGFKASRRFRGNIINIVVKNPNKVEKGVKSITVDGKVVTGNVVPADMLSNGCNVEVIMG
ncbi:MAG: hypothetical protein UH850_03380, partial [Paludibacteraceae bacterium]|nr:hypothetical protein [Paludibacteraceae bacterium]